MSKRGSGLICKGYRRAHSSCVNIVTTQTWRTPKRDDLASMRHFSLLIENEVHGPLTEEEIRAMISDGSVTSETLCAPSGAQEWVALSKYFSFGSNLKIKRTKQVSTEAEDQIAASRLNQELRRKLLTYGLAEASTVDTFTQIQADAAVRNREQSLRSKIRAHKIARLVSFAACLPLAFIVASCTPPGAMAVGYIASLSVPEQGSAKSDLLLSRKSIQDMRASINRIKSIPFGPPTGNLPTKDVLINRLHPDPATSYILNGRMGHEDISKKFAKSGPPIPRTRRLVHLLKEIPSGRLKELLDLSEKALGEPSKVDWERFQKKHGKELGLLLAKATLVTRPISDKGAFTFEGIPPINDTFVGGIVVEMPYGSDKILATLGAKFLEQIEWDAKEISPDIYLSLEKYFVVNKTTVGAKPMKAKVGTPVHSFDISRTSPEWRYLAIARQNEKSSIYLLVRDEKKFTATQIGDQLEIPEILSLPCFAAPAESPVPPGLEER